MGLGRGYKAITGCGGGGASHGGYGGLGLYWNQMKPGENSDELNNITIQSKRELEVTTTGVVCNQY